MKYFCVSLLIALSGLGVGCGGEKRHSFAQAGDPVKFLSSDYTVGGCATTPSKITIQLPSSTKLTQVVCKNDTIEWKESTTTKLKLVFDSPSCFNKSEDTSVTGDLKEMAQNDSQYALQVCKYSIYENDVLTHDPHIIIIDGK